MPEIAMPLFNTATRYGTISQSFHWLTAVLVVAAYVLGEGGPESAGNVSHLHRGATVSGHANTKDQRGHLPKEVTICPKKDDVAMLAVISLGYDSPRTLTASEAAT